ncbi:MAG: EAL domain-containing protein [Rhodocyclaceae bacterium]|nr:EAL domain-containing protein [Rhodocyclaceae bacterium]
MKDSVEILRDVDLLSNEALREALYSMHYQQKSLSSVGGQLQLLLDAVSSLLDVGTNDSPFLRAFSVLHRGLAFSHAMMLVVEHAPGTSAEYLRCIEAERKVLVDTHWPIHRLFKKVLAGHVVCTLNGRTFEEWKTATEYGMSLEDSALLVPVHTLLTRGVLMLVIDGNAHDCFKSSHVALMRRYGVLLSNALVGYEAAQSAEESQRLRDLTERLRASVMTARRNADLINEIVRRLPVGVSVQDSEGRVQLINNAAAKVYPNRSAESLMGHYPPGFMKHEFLDRLRSGVQTQETEAIINGEHRYLQMTFAPVSIFDETLLLNTVQDVTEYRAFEEQLRHNTFHDQLTGLPNRALAKEIVDRRVQVSGTDGSHPFVFAVLNLDGFKQINDYYNHTVGDNVLKFVASIVQGTLTRENDSLSRISGDEFLLILNLDSPDEASARLEKVLDEIRRPVFSGAQKIFLSASIGAAIYPVHGHDYRSLNRAADSALARAKFNQRGSFCFFDPDLDGGDSDRMVLEQRLHSAVRERTPMRAAYQPKVLVERGEQHARVVGFEALARWVDEAGVVHPPATFIELAAELGLLDEITLIMLERIANDLPALRGVYGNDIGVSFNVSAQQIGNPAFVDKMLKTIEELGVASSLILEITEDALIGVQQFQDRVLPKLRYSGVRVAIDDFGTGYSSLSVLADITADELKIDRAFVASIHDRLRSQSVLKAIDSVGSALEIAMVAEGVESRAEADYLLRNTHISVIQGFFFGRPAFAEYWMTNVLDPQAVLNAHPS